MKNKIIVSIVFILPLVIYFVLLSFSPASSFEQAVFANSKLPRVIYFSTQMCGECKKFSPVIEQAENDYKDKIEFFKVNALDKNKAVQKLVKEHKIYVVPTVIYFDKDGNAVARSEGYLSYRELKGYLKDIQ